MVGDSAINLVGSNTDIIYDSNYPAAFNFKSLNYQRFPVGTAPNVYQEPQGAQGTVYHAVVLEQDFIVMQQQYEPIALNSTYDAAYWTDAVWGTVDSPSSFCINFSLPVAANEFYLVKEFPLEDMGGGMWKYRRQYATIPPTRNYYEKFTYNYIGLSEQQATPGFNYVRGERTQITVPSRLQIDYVMLDSYGVQSGMLFQWPNGPLLTIFDPTDGSFFLKEQQYFNPGSASGSFVPADVLTDDPSGPTNPTLTQYADWVGPGIGTGASVAQIIAEPSYVIPYMGNIWQRITRFVPAL